jgi:periplasmic protein TonB
MESNNILKADLLDIVFDKRNKAYGAYELRVTYPDRIKKAMFITLGISILIFTSAVWANSRKKEEPKVIVDVIYTPSAVPTDVPKPLPPPPKQPAAAPAAKVKQDVYVKPVLVDEPPSPPAPVEVFNNDTKIAIKKVDGIDDPGEIDPLSIVKTKGIIEDKNADVNDGGGFTPIEKEAQFDGDWIWFLQKNLRAEVASNNDAPAGTYRVEIQFVVDVDGKLSNITALTKHGYGMEEEAIRVIKQSKKWVPAFQNGVHVKAYRKQLVTFVIGE